MFTSSRTSHSEEKCAMQSEFVDETTVDNENDQLMDDIVFEQICDTIFTLIPEVPRLKQLFLSWSQLGREDRILLDAKITAWGGTDRKQLYKPLREALSRWENVQDTQGAPGCEPGMVSFACDPQLEEELANVICGLEIFFLRKRDAEEDGYAEIGKRRISRTTPSIADNLESFVRFAIAPKDRTPHSVHSCGYITDHANSDDEFGGYVTN